MEGEHQGGFWGARDSLFLDLGAGCGTEQDPVGLLGLEAFLFPPFLVCREQTPASLTFPEFQREDSNSC